LLPLFVQVMRVWADLGKPEKAEAAMMELLSRSEQDEDAASSSKSSSSPLVPNSESYALVIRGWLAAALSERGDKFALAQAVRWLDAVRDVEERDPSGTSSVLTQVDMYGGIIAAARTCAPRHPDVLDIAMKTFDKLRKSHHPVDCLHYSRLLQVGIAALGSRRPGMGRSDRLLADFVARIFRDCCEDGLMSKPFLRALVSGPPSSSACSSSSHQSWTAPGEHCRIATDLLLPFCASSDDGVEGDDDDDEDGDNGDHSPFPASWTRNVRQVGLLPTRHDLERALVDVRR
jgi:hypothetical protein